MESLWTLTNSLKIRGALKEDISTNTLVIGGGMAGILIAYFLQKKGINCVVLEASKVGSGQTKNTTAKITLQHAMQYQRMLQHFDKSQAKQYADANQNAISDYFKIVKDENIDCMLEEKPAYLYSKKDYKLLELEYEAAKELGICAELTSINTLPIGEVLALRFDNQAQFDPLKFLSAISAKLTVYEDTKVTAVEEHKVYTQNAVVTADNIVVATHFPFINSPGYYFMRMHQERSYVIALENAPDFNGMYYGVDADGLSFRNSGGFLLVGGGGHRTGDNSEGGMYDLLREFIKEYLPQSREITHWSAQDCIPIDGVPYIGQYSSSTPYMFTATGFQKWGMTSSMVSAKIISELISGKEHPYPIFSPQRFNISASAKALIKDGAESVKGLSAGIFSIPSEKLEEIELGRGGIVEHDGNKIGVYKNEYGQVFSVSTRCTHLGCQLEWNPDELSWDCPCHGSRFDYRGKLIDNPAMKCLDNIGENEENGEDNGNDENN